MVRDVIEAMNKMIIADTLSYGTQAMPDAVPAEKRGNATQSATIAEQGDSATS